jgi:hypothetical protein
MLQYVPQKVYRNLIKNTFLHCTSQFMNEITPLESVMGHLNPVQIFTPYFSKIALTLSLYSTDLPQRFPEKCVV